MIYDSVIMGQALRGIALTFTGPGRGRAWSVLLGLGTLITAFYLVMLPSSAVGGFSLVALQYLTPALAVVAVLLGYGFALTLALNASAFEQRSRAAGAVGIGGLLAAVLPGSLCCTSIVPSILAALGASVPTVLGTTGKIASVFAVYEDVFIAASIVGVALSIVLSARSCAASCSPATQRKGAS
jgi:hypothetical protein